MAYRRSLTTSSNILARRFNPSCCYVIHVDDRKCRSSSSEGSNQHGTENFLQGKFSTTNINTLCGFGTFGRERSCHPFSLPSTTGIDICRHMSSSTGGSSENIELLNDISDKIELHNEITDVFPDTTLETVVQQAPVLNEVAIAAADSFPPVAYLQHLIDGVHTFTGCNWWASIGITTLLIRVATIPLLINQLKAMTKLTLMRPHLEKIQEEMQNSTDPDAQVEGSKQMILLFQKYDVSAFTPFKGLLIQGPVLISFFLGISNMAEKVPSFKYGGVYWFTDLSTPDSLYIFPCLTALSLLVMTECNMQDGLEGNPVAGTMKKFYRVFAFLTVPFTLAFPNAIFCYWITSNMFSLMYGAVIKRPQVKKFLSVPTIPPAPPSTTPRTDDSLASAYQQYKDVVARQTTRPIVPTTDSPADSAADLPADLPVDSHVTNRKISSSALINQRIRSLEKLVKARKNNKE